MRVTRCGPAPALRAARSIAAIRREGLFVAHLGEAIFRNDTDNSVPDLGDLLIHQGPALAAQQAAAKVFGADLRAHNVVPEKCDLNSILFRMTTAIKPGKCASLISRLVAFTQLHDADAPLAQVLPGTLAAYPDCYAG